MATPIPAALKAADISRFALRAAQLEKAKPIISYWCNYWIVNNIISNNLQNADEESKLYTVTVMDKLEQFKKDHAEEDAINDDMAGKAYIEQFGLDTFQRADNAVRANKASRQTADTFQASATFLELLQIFGALESEISQKIKFAKYHALRIAKALKAGDDPNLSNPKSEPTPEEGVPSLEKNDLDMLEARDRVNKPRQPSVQEVPDEADRLQNTLAQTSTLDESIHPSRASSVPRPPRPSVQEIPDDADQAQRILAQRSILDESLHPSRSSSIPRPPGAKVEDAQDEADHVSRAMAQQSLLDESLHPSRTPSVPGTVHVDPSSAPPAPPPVLTSPTNAEAFYTSSKPASSPYVSPLDPPTDDRKSSIGGNYFPEIPSPPSPPSGLPSDASAPPPNLPSFVQPFLSTPPPDPSHSAQQPFPPQGSQPQLPHFIPPHNIPPSFQPKSQLPPPQPQPPPPQLRNQPPTQSFYSQPPQQPQPPSQSPAAPTVVDEEAMMKAQKHARWAISALNFEDVGTAVRELKGALEALGVR